MNKKFILLAIIIVAVVLRFYRLGEVPMGLFGDEVDAGYNAYSIWKTGNDYNGNLFPIHTESLGDFRSAGLFWVMAPVVGWLGLSDFSVRLVPAVSGVLMVFAVYLLFSLAGKSIWRGKGSEKKAEFFGISAAFITAISPWTVHFSRIGLEQTLLMFFIILGVYVLINFRNRKYTWLLGFVLIALSLYAYHIAKLMSPLILVGVLLIFYREFYKKAIIGLVIFVLLIFPLIYDSFWGMGQSRFGSINIWNDPKMVESINYHRGQISDYSSPVQRFFQNKAVSAGWSFVNNYWSDFAPDFLFISGDVQNVRHSIPGFGLFYWWMLPFWGFGLYSLWKYKSNRFVWLFVFWLLSGPIPASLTQGGAYHAIRLFVWYPAVLFVICLGMTDFINLKCCNKKLKFVLPILSLVMLLTLGFYLERYFSHYSQSNYRQWEYGFEPLIQKVTQYESNYDQIIITKSYAHLPALYYAFYTQYDPRLFQKQLNESDKGTSKPPTDVMGKVKFETIGLEDSFVPENTLYVGSAWEKNIRWDVLDKVVSPDPMESEPVFWLLSSKK